MASVIVIVVCSEFRLSSGMIILWRRWDRAAFDDWIDYERVTLQVYVFGNILNWWFDLSGMTQMRCDNGNDLYQF